MFPNSEGNELIVLVGNMISEVKGHLVLISAAVEIVRRHPKTQFVLVGEGPKRAEFAAQVASSGLKENFLFLGRRTDVAQILACCDIAVLPSLAEGLPNAVLEYLAAGLPVVASALGGNLEVIQDGITGLLVPAQDSRALAHALTRLVEDQEFSTRLARAGQEHVARYFSFERLVAEVGKLYTSQLRAATPQS
jgi:glycosyltransferase involved in cell wall biosynthesis